MGLDITAYKNLEKVRDFTDPDEDYYSEGLTHLYANPDFTAHFEGLDEKALYKAEETHGFRAGSYGGYNEWRNGLPGSSAPLQRRHGLANTAAHSKTSSTSRTAKALSAQLSRPSLQRILPNGTTAQNLRLGRRGLIGSMRTINTGARRWKWPLTVARSPSTKANPLVRGLK